MVGMSHHHTPRHARKRQEATADPVPAAELPERFWPLRDHAEKVARGLWTDPALEDWIASLRREHEAWLREQREG